MIWSRARSDAWNRSLEDAITNLAHLLEDGLKFSVICNRRFVKGSLLLREGDAHRLGFNFACQPPGPRRLGHDTALSDPSQLQQLLFQAPVALLQAAQGGAS